MYSNSKLPGGLMNRWKRTTQAIRRKQIMEPDLQDLILFVQEETTLENDLLFSSAALHEYTKGSAKQNQRKLKQIKNFFVKDDKKDVYVDSSGLKPSLKCQFCDGNHDLDAANFTMSFQLRIEAVFLKKNKLWYRCYRETKSTLTARTSNNRRVCQTKHPSGLNGYKMKSKKTSDDDENKTGEQKGAVKSICVGIKNAATVVGEVISMCVVLVRLRHCNSWKEVKTFALLDSCSQGTFVKDTQRT